MIHDHLDQGRRDRGLCEACDRLWALQDQVVEARQWEEVAAQHGATHRQQLWRLGTARYIRRPQDRA